MNRLWMLGCCLLILLLIGCQPDAQDLNREALRSEINEVLLTARSDIPPTATLTPQPTFTPSPSPTPLPDLVVLASELDVYQAPIKSYGIKFSLSPQDQVRVLGRDAKCKWLQVLKNDQDVGWLRNAASNVDLNLECDGLPFGVFRPKTGMIVLDKRQRQDSSALIVENGLSSDGVVIVAASAQKPVLAFYIRGNDKYTMEGIPTGNFHIFFSTGEKWLVSANHFSQNAHYQMFEETLEFISGYDWRITLHPVLGGTASAEDVEELEFPVLSQE